MEFTQKIKNKHLPQSKQNELKTLFTVFQITLQNNKDPSI